MRDYHCAPIKNNLDLLADSFPRHSNVDLKSEEAYDLAVQGQLRPKVKSPPLILALRCLEFSPPDFTLGMFFY